MSKAKQEQSADTGITHLESTIATHVRAAAKRRGGSITPEQLVADASRPRHPLHDHFEWDDAEAGRKLRIMQAKVIITAVTMSIPLDGGGVRKIREFVPIRDESGTKFVTATVVQTKDQHKANALQQLHAALVSIKKRYGTVIDMCESEIDTAISIIETALSASRSSSKKKKTAKKSKRTSN